MGNWMQRLFNQHCHVLHKKQVLLKNYKVIFFVFFTGDPCLIIPVTQPVQEI